MKRWLILAALVVAISATATAFVQFLPSEPADGTILPTGDKDSGPPPVAVVEGERIWRFGNKPQYEKFGRDWIIKNTGQGELVMHFTSATCSCTVAEFPNERDSKTISVPPGGQTTLHVKFDTAGKEGAFSQAATIGTNDPKQPTLVFGVDGQVHPAIVLVPPDKAIFVATIHNDTEYNSSIALFSPDRPATKVVKVSSSNPEMIKVSAELMTKEERKNLKLEIPGYKIIVRIKPGDQLGLFHEKIKIQTDHPKQPEVELDMGGKVSGPIVALPPSLEKSLPAGGHDSVTVSVRGLRETKFTVDKKPGNLDVSIAPLNPTDPKKKGFYKLTVNVPPNTPPGKIDGEIVLKTDHPKASVIKIPISLIIQRPTLAGIDR